MEALHVIVLLAVLVLASRGLRRRKTLPLPPGPKGLPLVGSFFSRPVNPRQVEYGEWAATYGDLVYYEVLGQPYIVVSSDTVATELFEKRSSNYSDRHPHYMLFDLMKFTWNVSFFRYSDSWRLHRKILHQYFNANAVTSYQPVQLSVTIEMLRKILQTPDDFFNHVRHHAGSIALRITYGYESTTREEEYIELVDRTIRELAPALNVGSYLVDYLPFLRFIPSWFPFATFQRQAKIASLGIADIRDQPFDRVTQAMAEGYVSLSFLAENLQKIQEKPPGEDRDTMLAAVKNVAAIMFAAGADTTVAGVLTCVLAMVHHPAIQHAAQAELDVVVGRGRLPNFTDRDSLPIIHAIILEALRWRPVIPVDVDHASLTDDIYEGYFIPGGSTIFTNTWAILHDEEVYKDAGIFNPQRFMGNNPEPDPTIRGAFGYGRRICPGRYLAMNSMFIAVASILWAFNLEKARDKDGNEVLPDDKAYLPDFLMHPLPFQCKITPRFPEMTSLLAMGEANE
ncbi:cytochrome P450 [Mucidula mucida]|nr:cytochrome P450 [Mucidula mucida]